MNDVATLPKSNREAVLSAIQVISDHREAASKQQIVNMTGINTSVVNDHVKALREDGLITMVQPGWYAPIDQEPDRLVSTTNMPRGRMKIEIGDSILELNPREAFSLAKQLAGLLLAFRSGV